MDDKWRYTFYSAVVVLILVNSYSFQFTQRIFGNIVTVSSPEGCPTFAGLLIHVLVFSLIIRYMMDLKI